MSNQSINNNRIAKNTFFLYLRTLFVMLVSLYTSRVVLSVLGVEDYGVYQVIGGLVSMFSIISASLSAAISRFITFELGSGNQEKLKRIFATSLLIQVGISIVVVLIAEIVGLWFLESKMQIPEGRMNAAHWVLQCSLITFCFNLLSVPYNACIIAHERMKAFAYVSVVEVLLKLGIVYLISISPIDRLISYAILLTITAVIIRLIYTMYCHRNFEESKTKIVFDKAIFKEMLGFSGWSFFNNTSFILSNQGVNMLINIFFGVTVNAARGIAIQVESAVLQFVNNFTTAINPQITKSYAGGDLENMYKLVCRGAKFSYFSMLLLALPIIIEAKQILEIWLVNVPDHAVTFVQLSLVMGMCDCIGNSGYTACIATGKIKKYSLIIASIGCLEFPLAWIFFTLGAIPECAYYTYIVIKIAVLFARMYLMDSMIGLKVGMYIKNVFAPIILTTMVAVIIPIVIYLFMDFGIIRFISVGCISVLSVALSALYLGMTKNERDTILDSIIKKIIKR